jgi:hypothetical protein
MTHEIQAELEKAALKFAALPEEGPDEIDGKTRQAFLAGALWLEKYLKDNA